MSKTKINENSIQKLKSLFETNAPKSSELVYSIGDEELKIKVNPIISFTKRIQLVREIVDSVFMDNKNTVHTYAPEILTLVKRHAVIKCFTDLSLPDKLDDMWLILNYTSIYQDVIEIVGIKEIESIFKDAEDIIEVYKQYLATKTDANIFMDKITEFVSNIKSKINEESISKALSTFEKMSQGTELKDIANAFLANKNK